MVFNCFSCFIPTVTEDDTNAAPSTSIPGPSTSRDVPLTSERGRVDSIHEVGSSSQPQNTHVTQQLGLAELQVATSNFTSECLGEGGFGKVYKGYFVKEEQEVAIKQLNPQGGQGTQEFVAELKSLKNVDYQNLIKLLAFCVAREHRLLVYEYMALGSLDRHLFDLPPSREPLDWKTRIKIAIDVGSGLEYLHHKRNPNIIHSDLKCTNILLGEGYHAKISDFGMAIEGPTSNKTHVSRRIIGSYGYLAPKYNMTGLLTLKSDIYSFGIILLELITGRKAYDSTLEEVIVWVKSMRKNKEIWRLADSSLLVGEYSRGSLQQAFSIALQCVHEKPKKRPSIVEVLQDLQTIIS